MPQLQLRKRDLRMRDSEKSRRSQKDLKMNVKNSLLNRSVLKKNV